MIFSPVKNMPKSDGAAMFVDASMSIYRPSQQIGSINAKNIAVSHLSVEIHMVLIRLNYSHYSFQCRNLFSLL